jgi:methylmalonyl-CoA mutase
MTKQNLFKEFPPVSTEEWESVIKTDLRGADYDKKLIWKSQEGFSVKPYYRAEDLTNTTFHRSVAGDFPYLRGNKTSGNNWEVRFSIEVSDPVEANQKALYFLNRGVTSLKFSFKPNLVEKSDLDQQFVSRLFKDIYLDCVEINFDAGSYTSTLLRLFIEYAKTNGFGNENLNGSVSFDPFNNLVKTGNFYINEAEDFQLVRDNAMNCLNNLPKFRTAAVNTAIFGDSGALITQEIAFALAAGSEYLDVLAKEGLSVDAILQKIHFTFSTGSDFFSEIARFRAFRFLWSKLAESWKPETMASAKTYIHSVTSDWNQTIYDAYVNLLRNTTSAMSAILGGTDSVEVIAFDSAFRFANEFSERIAINTQLILKEESWLDKVLDPAAGSYYIENLTQSIIQKSWSIFLEIEDKGGYLTCLKEGIIQDIVESSAKSRINNVSSRKEILLGTNQFPDYHELVSSLIEKDFISYHPPIQKNAKILNQQRSSSELESIRLKSENYNKRPKAFMLTIGNRIMRLARANFSCNFFACGGFEVIDNSGFDNTESGVECALENQSDIIVICSSDEEYTTIAPEIYRLLTEKYSGKDKKPILVVAGAPPCMEELKSKGIDHFIHMRSNLVQTLKAYQIELGMDEKQ